jgi:hypothetical protein
VLENRLRQATLPLPILTVSCHDAGSGEWFELVPDLSFDLDVLRIDQDVPDLVGVRELLDVDIAHPIPDNITQQLLARAEQPRRVSSSLLQMTEQPATRWHRREWWRAGSPPRSLSRSRHSSSLAPHPGKGTATVASNCQRRVANLYSNPATRVALAELPPLASGEARAQHSGFDFERP